MTQNRTKFQRLSPESRLLGTPGQQNGSVLRGLRNTLPFGLSWR
jgi:hypothetical protein